MITVLFLFMQKLRKRLTLKSVLAERKALRNVGDGNFRPCFYKKLSQQWIDHLS